MKKRSKALKQVGLALAGLSTAFAGNVFAAQESKHARHVPQQQTAGVAKATGAVVETRGGLTVIDPCNDWYWFSIGGRLEFDEVIFSGNYRDKQGNFPNSGNIRRGFLALNGGIGECFTYNLTVDFGRTASAWADNIDNDNNGLALPYRTRPGVLFADTSTLHGVVLIEDAWLGYNGLWDCTSVRFGQFTPLATMDGYTNYGITSSQMFLESALATRAFDVPSYIQSDSRAMKGFGIILNTELADLFTVGGTVYQPAHGPQNVYGDRRRSDRVGGALRLTFSPVHECDYALHAGFLARYQSMNHTDSSRLQSSQPGTTASSNAIINTLFFTTPEVTPRNYVGNPANLSAQVNSSTPVTGLGNATYDPNIVNTGAIRTKSFNHFAGELAAVWGPFTAQGEYHYANVQRLPFATNIRQCGNVAFHGWHVQAGYVLTGESRGYNFATGTLGTITPCSPCGAWEIAARYSYLNLRDKDVYGGAANNVTLGLNWYANENVRFAFNYLRSNITPTGVIAGQQPVLGQAAKRKLDIMAARIQVVF